MSTGAVTLGDLVGYIDRLEVRCRAVTAAAIEMVYVDGCLAGIAAAEHDHGDKIVGLSRLFKVDHRRCPRCYPSSRLRSLDR
jgi:hypothetical protein